MRYVAAYHEDCFLLSRSNQCVSMIYEDILVKGLVYYENEFNESFHL